MFINKKIIYSISLLPSLLLAEKGHAITINYNATHGDPNIIFEFWERIGTDPLILNHSIDLSPSMNQEKLILYPALVDLRDAAKETEDKESSYILTAGIAGGPKDKKVNCGFTKISSKATDYYLKRLDRHKYQITYDKEKKALS